MAEVKYAGRRRFSRLSARFLWRHVGWLAFVPPPRSFRRRVFAVVTSPSSGLTPYAAGSLRRRAVGECDDPNPGRCSASPVCSSTRLRLAACAAVSSRSRNRGLVGECAWTDVAPDVRLAPLGDARSSALTMPAVVAGSTAIVVLACVFRSLVRRPWSDRRTGRAGGRAVRAVSFGCSSRAGSTYTLMSTSTARRSVGCVWRTCYPIGSPTRCPRAPRRLACAVVRPSARGDGLDAGPGLVRVRPRALETPRDRGHDRRVSSSPSVMHLVEAGHDVSYRRSATVVHAHRPTTELSRPSLAAPVAVRCRRGGSPAALPGVRACAHIDHRRWRDNVLAPRVWSRD